MSREKILVVEDEVDILRLIEYTLVREDFAVYTAESGNDALTVIRDKKPDLLLLDLMLPDLNGIEICRIVRKDPWTSSIPVIMVTAKGEDKDVIKGLEAGADDYIIKPFSPRVLLARVNAVLRRTEKNVISDEEIITVDELVINPGKHSVTVRGKDSNLTATEFKILHALAKRAGWAFSRYQIVEITQGDDAEVTDRSIDVHIASLRRKMDKSAYLIETVRGVGYRFKG